MAVIALVLLAIVQVSIVYGLPAGEIYQKAVGLNERAISTSANAEPTTSYSTAITSLQSLSISILPSITGSILPGLPSDGIFTQDPVHGPGVTQSENFLCPLETPLAPGPTVPFRPVSANIFQPIATGSPAQSLPFRGGHYAKKEHIVDRDVPIQTNKFYANFFLGGQGNPVWTHPYHLVWAKGIGETRSYGMAISHTERSQFAYGPPEAGNKPRYFISPIGIHHMVLSAEELGRDTVLSVEELRAFSVYANFAPSEGAPVAMTMPVVQGMGLVTAIYDDARPMIRSGVFFRSFDFIGVVGRGTYKWRVTLNDNSVWMFYVTSIGSTGIPPFVLVNSSTIAGPSGFKGMVQVSKNPAGLAGEEAFDETAGAYAANTTISGTVDGSTGSYTLSWGKGGVQSKTLLMYALPHHVESFDQESKAALRDIRLVTTTKGYAQAVLADRVTMVENDLPNTIGFAPWAKSNNGGSGGTENVDLGTAALALVNNVAHAELSQDFIAQTSLNSMYYSGKGLAKFAAICYTVSNIAGNRNLAASGLLKLKDAFNVFVNNTQPEPLVYDTVWKGVVSGATYRPPYDPGLDFGNTLYNDHHFHYGYFLYTAAVIGYLDPDWLNQGSNKAWVNTLARDFANPVTDEYFPFQRSFDWYHGHSWAKGLFESGDGKDQESTSEDTFATYALKMWGKIIRDSNMEARGNLQLAVQARSLRNYFLMTSDNKNQPPSFLHNKVTGILFENKIDHTTYFGGNTEYIEGIHMIPLNPTSAYTRPRQFVDEEWDTYFSNGRADAVEGGWKAILYANYALINPQKAYDFFSAANFNTPLDGGASRTWYIAYTAALLGAQKGIVQADIRTNNTTPLDTTNNEPGQSGQPGSQSHSKILPVASSVPVPEDNRPWPHGFNWPQVASATTAASQPILSPTQSEIAKPSATPITKGQTSVDENRWASTPLPSPPSAQNTNQPQSNPAAPSTEGQQEVEQFQSPDMSWALQDKDTDDDNWSAWEEPWFDDGEGPWAKA
ncbi:glycosyl hydrolase family 81-domain-containing protein [Ampelomyces quisqualis]|uniref:glucan endo-1,3-beta-D-glucosidase n=1 Tax=Ampelomyces quisqualis TaxID=50730 RepID=A0A6A5QNM5_AMPQU|nr:glycosyl hydrolase family 81-domain-containing protein [Ampelomyces quisqualis]